MDDLVGALANLNVQPGEEERRVLVGELQDADLQQNVWIGVPADQQAIRDLMIRIFGGYAELLPGAAAGEIHIVSSSFMLNNFDANNGMFWIPVHYIRGLINPLVHEPTVNIQAFQGEQMCYIHCKTFPPDVRTIPANKPMEQIVRIIRF